MKKLLLLIATSFFIPTFAQAQKMRIVNRVVVMQDIQAFPDNGGINPEFAATHVQAKVMLGANACTAQGLKARFVVSQEADGRRYLSAVVSGEQPQQLVCTYIYQPVYANISIVLRDRVGFEETTTLVNAFEDGLNVKLSKFLKCAPATACTRELNPQVCEFKGRNFEGSNPCVTTLQVKTYACVKNIKFDPRELVCSSQN